MSSIFRIKFAYTEMNDSGKVVKKKMECLAQCENYTDAESLVNVLIDRERFNNVSYEIIKTKTDTYSILLNKLLGTEDKLTNKLNELFFSRDNDCFVSIKIKVFATVEGDKDETEEYIIPASSNAAAIEYLSGYLLANNSQSADDYMVLESKRDNAELLFLAPSLYESKMSKSID